MNRGGKIVISLSADVDADANRAVRGRVVAVSPGKHGASYDACWEGLKLLLEILQEKGISATFFLEGRACRLLAERGFGPRTLESHEVASHGLAHEDFTGRQSGIIMSYNECRSALENSIKAIHETTGRLPRGFRAPYTRIHRQLFEAAADAGFMYDSSITKEAGAEGFGAARLISRGRRLVELPLAEARDTAGRKMGSYLWPVFEGRRNIAEYALLVERLMREGRPFLQFALHPWHIVVDENGRRFGDLRIRENLDSLRFLCGFLSGLEGAVLVPLGEAMERLGAEAECDFEDYQGAP